MANSVMSSFRSLTLLGLVIMMLRNASHKRLVAASSSPNYSVRRSVMIHNYLSQYSVWSRVIKCSQSKYLQWVSVITVLAPPMGINMAPLRDRNYDASW